MLDDTNNVVAAVIGWSIIGGLPVVWLFSLVWQGLNRPWRKHVHKLKVDARWKEICTTRGIQSPSEGK
jgi:hypothetical protein